MPKSEVYRGKPAAMVLDSKRVRMYRTVLREGAKQGPNFAGHYTIVTWGAGLGVFSMAVIDAKTGKVYFPAFKEVGNTSYGLPYIDTRPIRQLLLWKTLSSQLKKNAASCKG